MEVSKEKLSAYHLLPHSNTCLSSNNNYECVKCLWSCTAGTGLLNQRKMENTKTK